MSNSKDAEAKKEMCELIKRKSEIQQKLTNLEQQIYNFETTYLEQSTEHGNIMRGFSKLFESTISGIANAASVTLSANAANKGRRPPKRHFEESDRLFSLSSVTSPISQSINGMISGQDANVQNGLKRDSLTNGEKSTKKEVNHSRNHRDQNCQSPAESTNKDGEYGGVVPTHNQHKRTRHF